MPGRRSIVRVALPSRSMASRRCGTACRRLRLRGRFWSRPLRRARAFAAETDLRFLQRLPLEALAKKPEKSAAKPQFEGLSGKTAMPAPAKSLSNAHPSRDGASSLRQAQGWWRRFRRLGHRAFRTRDGLPRPSPPTDDAAETSHPANASAPARTAAAETPSSRAETRGRSCP